MYEVIWRSLTKTPSFDIGKVCISRRYLREIILQSIFKITGHNRMYASSHSA